jgi:hypothetical protein
MKLALHLLSRSDGLGNEAFGEGTLGFAIQEEQEALKCRFRVSNIWKESINP